VQSTASMPASAASPASATHSASLASAPVEPSTPPTQATSAALERRFGRHDGFIYEPSYPWLIVIGGTYGTAGILDRQTPIFGGSDSGPSAQGAVNGGSSAGGASDAGDVTGHRAASGASDASGARVVGEVGTTNGSARGRVMQSPLMRVTATKSWNGCTTRFPS